MLSKSNHSVLPKQTSSDKNTEFAEQGGIATMDPSRLRRWVISKLMTSLASEANMLKKRVKAEKLRKKGRLPHVVEYFHQVDDGYSHLCAQFLIKLQERYDIELRCYIVDGPTGLNIAEPELLSNLAVVDAKRIAPFYGAKFSQESTLPVPANIALAQSIIAHQPTQLKPEVIAKVSKLLWESDATSLARFAEESGKCEDAELTRALQQGNTRRNKLNHYSGAMFYYGGEWYWGLDRLHYLEKRLVELGASVTPNQPLLAKRCMPKHTQTGQSVSLTLEIYASLRSPYTAIAFDRAISLAQKNGIKHVVKPVLPMVMRGVPATKNKGFYICFDTAREARTAGVPYGNVYDPIGEPARRGYALYFWACNYDKGDIFFSNFLRAAFVEGVNTNKLSGLKYVIEQSGLSWSEAQSHLNDDTWQEKLETNRLKMYNCGIWGVPSFRLLDKDGEEIFATWGQDRLWLIEEMIQQQKMCSPNDRFE